MMPANSSPPTIWMVPALENVRPLAAPRFVNTSVLPVFNTNVPLLPNPPEPSIVSVPPVGAIVPVAALVTPAIITPLPVIDPLLMNPAALLWTPSAANSNVPPPIVIVPRLVTALPLLAQAL